MTGQVSRRRRRLLAIATITMVLALLGGPADRPIHPAGASAENGVSQGVVDGRVAGEDGRARPGLGVEVFASLPRGVSGDSLMSAVTDSEGRFRFPIDDGCYLVEITAPLGDQFVGADRLVRRRVCVDGGRASASVNAVLRPNVATVSGMARTVRGTAVGHAAVDLYHDTDVAGRETDGTDGGAGHGAGYVASARTDDDGGYRLPVPAHGCYRLAVTGHPGATLEERTTSEVGFCVDGATRRVDLDVTTGGGELAHIGGRLIHEDGTGSPGLTVDLFAAAGDGTRGTLLSTATTGLGGRYSFDVPPSCYVVLLSAPPDSWFVGGRGSTQRRVCVDRGEVRTHLDGTLRGTAHSTTLLTPVEIELARLTNDLRTDPSGPLARRRRLPDCVDDPFYRITIDPATGHPEPAAPLALDETVSVEMARAWATRLETTVFEHRPPVSQRAFYGELGLPIRAWGENIAWLDGHDEAEVARTHFEGWRESTTGHYCAMITGRFTHVGVGEHHRGDRSWAVQNFFDLG